MRCRGVAPAAPRQPDASASDRQVAWEPTAGATVSTLRRPRQGSAGADSTGLVLVAFGQALRRQTPVTLGLASLGLACVAFQTSRAQYFGVAAGIGVLIARKLPGLQA